MPSEGSPPAGRRRWRRWLAAVLVAGAAYVAAANVYLVAAARPVIVVGTDVSPVRPYAIVLGSPLVRSGAPAPELAARLETALALYRAGRTAKVIVSGAAIRGYNEPRAMAAWLEARGVNAADILTDEGGHRTAATMKGSAAMGVRSALIVTQGYHLPRSLFFARHAGIDGLGVAAPVRREDALDNALTHCREIAARAEVVLEVALLGVR